MDRQTNDELVLNSEFQEVNPELAPPPPHPDGRPRFPCIRNPQEPGSVSLKTSGMSAAASLQQDAALHNPAALATLCFFFFFFQAFPASVLPSALCAAPSSAGSRHVATTSANQDRGEELKQKHTHTRHRGAASTCSSQ